MRCSSCATRSSRSLDRLTRRRTELGCRACRVRPAALAEASRLAAPAVEDVRDDGAHLVALDAEAGPDLRGELVGVLRNERDRADPRQAQCLERAALASGLGHEAARRAAAVGARAWRTSQPSHGRSHDGCRTGASRAGSVVLAPPRHRMSRRPPRPRPPACRRPRRRRRARRGRRAGVRTPARAPSARRRAARRGRSTSTQPAPMPTRSANAKSFSVSPPKKYSEATGSSVMNVVASERGMHLPQRDVADHAERRAPHQRHVLAHAVEDDDRVVDRVAEDVRIAATVAVDTSRPVSA